MPTITIKNADAHDRFHSMLKGMSKVSLDDGKARRAYPD